MCSCSRNTGISIPIISSSAPSTCPWQNLPDPEPISGLQGFPSSPHPPRPPPLLVLPRTLYPDHLSVGTLYVQQHPTVIYDFSVKLVDLMFRAVTERNGLGLLDLRDVVVDYLRSVISANSERVIYLTFMID